MSATLNSDLFFSYFNVSSAMSDSNDSAAAPHSSTVSNVLTVGAKRYAVDVFYIGQDQQRFLAANPLPRIVIDRAAASAAAAAAASSEDPLSSSSSQFDSAATFRPQDSVVGSMSTSSEPTYVVPEFPTSALSELVSFFRQASPSNNQKNIPPAISSARTRLAIHLVLSIVTKHRTDDGGNCVLMFLDGLLAIESMGAEFRMLIAGSRDPLPLSVLILHSSLELSEQLLAAGFLRPIGRTQLVISSGLLGCFCWEL